MHTLHTPSERIGCKNSVSDLLHMCAFNLGSQRRKRSLIVFYLLVSLQPWPVSDLAFIQGYIGLMLPYDLRHGLIYHRLLLWPCSNFGGCLH